MTETATAYDEKVKGYAHPEVLVSTDWVAVHLNDTKVRIVEADEDVLLYEVGHIPGAVKLDWFTELQNPIQRDFVDPEGFARLLGSKGIGNDTTVVLYGDKNNWYATYTFWLFKLYGHQDVRVMDGGRLKWEKEGRNWTRDVPAIAPIEYQTPRDADLSIRSFRDEVAKQSEANLPL